MVVPLLSSRACRIGRDPISFTIESVTQADIAEITTLNAVNVPHVNLVSEEEMSAFLPMPGHFLKVVEDGQMAGFVVALFPGADYGSMNYRWFSQTFENFLYIDRIVVSPHFRRRGVASLMYEHLATVARDKSVPRLTCEVNIKPPNPDSLAMHHGLGFTEAGRQQTEGGTKEVSLLSWELNP